MGALMNIINWCCNSLCLLSVYYETDADCVRIVYKLTCSLVIETCLACRLYIICRIVKEMIRRYPRCVNYLNCKEQTPLHLAAEVGHFEAVQTILNDHDPRVELDVNAK